MKIQDLDLRNLCCTIWNDVMVEMKEESGGRLNGMAVVPWWDPDRAVAETERMHRLGIKGINISADPQNSGMPDLSDDAALHLVQLQHEAASHRGRVWFRVSRALVKV